MRTWLLTMGMLLAAQGAVLADAGRLPKIYDLEIGDPQRRARYVDVAIDTIVETRSGEALTPEQVAGRLADVRVLLVGESHTSMESHRVQLRMIQALHEAGRRVIVGLEMFPATEQRYLDQWRAGWLTEQGFVQLSRWYEHWGYHWQFYRDIFLYARDAGLPMFALNTPREVVQAVRRKGLENLSADEARFVPPRILTDDPEHFAYFKASFEEGDMAHGGSDDEVLRSFAAAQATWDATMGYNAANALRQLSDPTAIMVVLVGSGHVAYGVGIERQLQQWFDQKVASLIPVPVKLADGRAIPRVRASYADFVWGLPAEIDTLFPRLGVSTRTGPPDAQREIIRVERDSPAAIAGFRVGDVLVSMDGQPIRDRETLNRALARKQWGDGAVFVVQRGEQQATLQVFFRRPPPRTQP